MYFETESFADPFSNVKKLLPCLKTNLCIVNPETLDLFSNDRASLNGLFFVLAVYTELRMINPHNKTKVKLVNTLVGLFLVDLMMKIYKTNN